MASFAQTRTPELVRWRTIINIRNDHYTLKAVDLSTLLSGPEIINELITRSAQGSNATSKFIQRYFFFRKPQVGIAYLSSISCSDTSLETHPLPVIISHIFPDTALNQAFKYPHLIQNTSAFLHDYSMFAHDIASPSVKSPLNQNSAYACCLFTFSLDRCALAVVIMFLVLLCAMAGLVAGLVSRRMDVGFLFAGGAMTLLAAAESAVFWILG